MSVGMRVRMGDGAMVAMPMLVLMAAVLHPWGTDWLPRANMRRLATLISCMNACVTCRIDDNHKLIRCDHNLSCELLGEHATIQTEPEIDAGS